MLFSIKKYKNYSLTDFLAFLEKFENLIFKTANHHCLSRDWNYGTVCEILLKTFGGIWRMFRVVSLVSVNYREMSYSDHIMIQVEYISTWKNSNSLEPTVTSSTVVMTTYLVIRFVMHNCSYKTVKSLTKKKKLTTTTNHHTEKLRDKVTTNNYRVFVRCRCPAHLLLRGYTVRTVAFSSDSIN